MPANATSTSVRHRRRRLLVHAAIFATAGVACLVIGPSTTSAAPTVQDGRYLEGGNLDVVFTCVGADPGSQGILDSIQLSSFPLAATIRTAAVEPSPSPGEDFDMEFTWDFSLPQDLVATAVDLGTSALQVSSDNPIGVVAGATGADTVGSGAAQVELGDGTVPVGYTNGPFTGTYNRTALADEPIVFAPGVVDSVTVTVPGGIGIGITCSPPDGTEMVLNDQDGVAPTTTTTTRPAVVTTAAPPTTAAVAATDQLPRTGSSSNLFLVLLALGLIDVGYLALTASRSPRHGRASSVS